MQRIFADFNDIGLYEDRNRVELGFEDQAPGLQGVALCEGERVLFHEPGSLEVEGVLRMEMVDGRRYWFGVVDSQTWHDVQK